MSHWPNPTTNYKSKDLKFEDDHLVFVRDEGDKRVVLSDITSISSESGFATALFQFSSSKQTLSYGFVDEAQRDECFEFLKARGFEATEARQSPMKAAGCAGCGSLVVLFFTAMTYMAARDLAAGEEATIRGRHRLMKRILAWLIDLIGPTGVLVAGGILLALLLLSAVSSSRNPPMQITLTPAE